MLPPLRRCVGGTSTPSRANTAVSGSAPFTPVRFNSNSTSLPGGRTTATAVQSGDATSALISELTAGEIQ